MSSSSSLSGARRRRAGGSQPLMQQPRQQQQQQQQQQPMATQISPMGLLQAHDRRLFLLESSIKELEEKGINENQDNNVNTNNVNTNNVNTNNVNIPNIKNEVMKFVNANIMNNIKTDIMKYLENEVDLKSFYENDQRLAMEIESLNKVVQSQQVLINNLNNTLYTIIDKLNIQNNKIETITTEKSTEPMEESVEEDLLSIDLVSEEVTDGSVREEVQEEIQQQSKNVTINEDNNVTMEISDVAENEDIMVIEPVD